MIRDCWVALNSEESIVERKMDSETYRKIGRGGAGNYYSKQDIEDAAKSAAEDIEAQSNAAALHAHGVQPSDSDYANVGRGGAGNFIKKENQSRSRMAPSSVAPLMRESAAPEMGFSGRGGAGNLRNGEIERQRLENENRAKEAREKSHAEVVRDVEMGLRMPERAHLGIQKVE